MSREVGGYQVSHIMQDTGEHAISPTPFPHRGTPAVPIRSASSNDLRGGQIFWREDAHAAILHLCPGTRHGKA